tara:strand:- start:911 stop:1183 length:273 start_codon:yes stop_codon:yes gene_type:complete
MPRGKTKKHYSKSKKNIESDDVLHEKEVEVELDDDDYIVQISEAIMYPFNMLSSIFNNDDDDDADEMVEEKRESKKKRGRPKTRRSYNKN